MRVANFRPGNLTIAFMVCFGFDSFLIKSYPTFIYAKIMKSTPIVKNNKLYPDDPGLASPSCHLNSLEWFAWLESATSFRYYSTQSLPVTRHYNRPMDPISVRKEQRRQQFLWYAYRRVHGQLYKRYVGRSYTLTTDRLDVIATVLNEL